jgi:3'(2'), 5'-bisphosphate nucleotidase
MNILHDLDPLHLCDIAGAAAAEILEVYARDFAVDHKEDDSPVTEADKRSHALLTARLTALFPHIPVISEEGDEFPYEIRKEFKRFFLVDPLDGTKEFIKKNDDFCINIGLIEDNSPVFGLIHLPVSGTCYFGGPGFGAYRLGAEHSEAVPIHTRPPKAGEEAVVLTSRSHASDLPNEILHAYPEHRLQAVGAAVKFCRLAEGAAQLYPRSGPTWEWDTAAGHALLLGAGGSFTKPDGGLFPYNKESLLNGGFLASA